LKWNKRDINFEKDLLKIKLFGQRPNTRHSKYIILWFVLYFENRNWPVARLKWLFFSWFFIFILNSDFGYIFWWSVIRWPFVNFKNKMLRLYQERLFLFLAFILSTYIITSSLIHEVTTLIEKLFQFWERRLSVQIAYLIENGFLKACNVGYGSWLWKKRKFTSSKRCLRVSKT
jgi:hypothetical protein